MCCKSRWIESLAVTSASQNDVQRLASNVSERTFRESAMSLPRLGNHARR